MPMSFGKDLKRNYQNDSVKYWRQFDFISPSVQITNKITFQKFRLYHQHNTYYSCSVYLKMSPEIDKKKLIKKEMRVR